MIWASFSHHAPHSLYFVDGRLNSQKFIKMLENGPLNTFNSFFGRNMYIFQQDNAPWHVSEYSRNYFSKHKIQTLTWPPCSPDLNPIENVFGILSEKLYRGGRIYKSTKELRESLTRIWEALDPITCANLVNSMEERCKDVLNVYGDLIKY